MPTPRTFTVPLDGFEVDVTRRRTSRATFRARPDGSVTLSVPLSYTKGEATRLVLENRRQLVRLRERALPPADKRAALACYERLEDGDTVEVWGRPCTVTVEEASEGPVRLVHEGDVLRFLQPRGQSLLEARLRRRAVFEAYLRVELKAAVPAVRAEAEALVGVHTERWSVRLMHTRWGSCRYTRGSVSLALDLATHDPAYLRLVAVHEVAHMVAPDHGRAFKAAMDRALPEWRELQKALDAEGMRVV